MLGAFGTPAARGRAAGVVTSGVSLEPAASPALLVRTAASPVPAPIWSNRRRVIEVVCSKLLARSVSVSRASPPFTSPLVFESLPIGSPSSNKLSNGLVELSKHGKDSQNRAGLAILLMHGRQIRRYSG